MAYYPCEKCSDIHAWYGGQERYDFTPSLEEKNHIRERFNYDLTVPNNFCRTSPVYSENAQKVKPQHS
nr:unnamed protein product [Callosobruchus analis]